MDFLLGESIIVTSHHFVKVQPAINGTQSLLGFIGISYLTFVRWESLLNSEMESLRN